MEPPLAISQISSARLRLFLFLFILFGCPPVQQHPIGFPRFPPPGSPSASWPLVISSFTQFPINCEQPHPSLLHLFTSQNNPPLSPSLSHPLLLSGHSSGIPTAMSPTAVLKRPPAISASPKAVKNNKPPPVTGVTLYGCGLVPSPIQKIQTFFFFSRNIVFPTNVLQTTSKPCSRALGISRPRLNLTIPAPPASSSTSHGPSPRAASSATAGSGSPGPCCACNVRMSTAPATRRRIRTI